MRKANNMIIVNIAKNSICSFDLGHIFKKIKFFYMVHI
jgi:hypothetical protein